MKEEVKSVFKSELELLSREMAFELTKAREDFAADINQVSKTMKSELSNVQTQVAASTTVRLCNLQTPTEAAAT